MPRHSARYDLVGQQFGLWTVISRAENYVMPNGKTGETRWNCHCECGNDLVVHRGALVKGATKSCGCAKSDLLRKAKTKHDRSDTRIYWVWSGMIERCHNPKHKSYSGYGGRGIHVCERWQNSFQAFHKDMGDRPSPKHQLDRRDTNGDYTPENTTWVTTTEQARNKRNNHTEVFAGIRMCLAEWAEVLQMSPTYLSQVLRRGSKFEDIARRALQTKRRRNVDIL